MLTNSSGTPRNWRCAAIALFATAALCLAAPCTYGLTAGQERVLPIENPRFSADNAEKNPIRHWRFESIALDINKAAASAKVRVEPAGEAALAVTRDQRGALLEGG